MSSLHMMLKRGRRRRTKRRATKEAAAAWLGWAVVRLLPGVTSRDFKDLAPTDVICQNSGRHVLIIAQMQVYVAHILKPQFSEDVDV